MPSRKDIQQYAAEIYLLARAVEAGGRFEKETRVCYNHQPMRSIEVAIEISNLAGRAHNLAVRRCNEQDPNGTLAHKEVRARQKLREICEFFGLPAPTMDDVRGGYRLPGTPDLPSNCGFSNEFFIPTL